MLPVVLHDFPMPLVVYCPHDTSPGNHEMSFKSNKRKKIQGISIEDCKVATSKFIDKTKSLSCNAF